jgi:hypothetical protein
MYIMKRNSTASAALFLLLAMAAGTQASPINPFSQGAAARTLPIPSEGYGLKTLVWGYPGAHRHGGFGAHPSLSRNGRSDFGPPAGLAKRPWSGFRFHRDLCGKAPGAGLVGFGPEGPELNDALNDADDEEETEVGETGEPVIAATGTGVDAAPEIPAVPEPGSLALMGAGILGLAAAGALRKRKR